MASMPSSAKATGRDALIALEIRYRGLTRPPRQALDRLGEHQPCCNPGSRPHHHAKPIAKLSRRAGRQGQHGEASVDDALDKIRAGTPRTFGARLAPRRGTGEQKSYCCIRAAAMISSA